MRLYEQYYHIEKPEKIYQLVDFDNDHKFLSDGSEMIAVELWLFDLKYRKIERD